MEIFDHWTWIAGRKFISIRKINDEKLNRHVDRNKLLNYVTR